MGNLYFFIDHLFPSSKHYMTTAVPSPPRLPNRNHLTPFPVPSNMLNAIPPPLLMGRTMPPVVSPSMDRISLASFPRAAMIDPRRLSSLSPMLQRALMSRMAAMQTPAHNMMTYMRQEQGYTRNMMTSMMQGRNMMPPTNPGMGFTNNMMNAARNMMTSMGPGMSRMFSMRQGLTPSRNMMSTPVWPNKKANGMYTNSK